MEVRYMISDAAKQVNVEAHVLRYWEDELELDIPRNEMGHRYYTDEHIRMFKNIKELKEKGYQLKAIKVVLPKLAVLKSEELESLLLLADELSKRNYSEQNGLVVVQENPEELRLQQQKRLEQFQEIMTQIVSRAMADNNAKLGIEISSRVNDKIIKELNYLMREKEEREEEKYKQLDELIRTYQRGGKEAAATKIPKFSKPKKPKAPSKFKQKNGEKKGLFFHSKST